MKITHKAVLTALTVLSITSMSLANADSHNFSDSAYPALPKAQSQKTRAEVKQELIEAQQNGFLAINDSQYPVTVDAVSSKTRAQVLKELEQSRSSGDQKLFDELYRG